ncbi:hypothetical protein KJ870_10925 [bacterium]|nr:hypothetical protein [bacterium]MBU1435442.1 hypothetical protein [bacterium]MBU1502634.1 hypothetical protein [bacterium]
MKYLDKKLAILFFPVIFIIGCADMNSSINNMNQTLYGVQNTLSGVHEQNIAPLISKFPDRTTKINFEQAQNTIQKGLSIMACADEGNAKLMESRMARYSVSGHCYKIHFPYWSKIKHHTEGCLTIERLNNFKSRDIDAFVFEATFVSKQSGESSVKEYRMNKVGNDWLFKF